MTGVEKSVKRRTWMDGFFAWEPKKKGKPRQQYITELADGSRFIRRTWREQEELLCWLRQDGRNTMIVRTYTWECGKPLPVHKTETREVCP